MNFPVNGSQLSFGCGIVAALTEILASTGILNVAPGHRSGCACLLAFLRTRPAMLRAANAIVEHAGGSKRRAGAATGAAAAHAGAGAEAAEGEGEAEAGAASAAAAAEEAAEAAKKMRTKAGGMAISSLVPAWKAAAAAQDRKLWSEEDCQEHDWQLVQANGKIPTAASKNGQQFLRGVAGEPQLRTLVGLENADPQTLVDNLGSASAGYACSAAVRAGNAAARCGEDPAGPGEQFDMSDKQGSKKRYLHADVPAAEYCERLGRAACGEGAWMDCTGAFDCKGCAARRVLRSASAASLECLVCEVTQVVKDLARPSYLGLQMENALFRLWSQVGCVSTAAVEFLL